MRIQEIGHGRVGKRSLPINVNMQVLDVVLNGGTLLRNPIVENKWVYGASCRKWNAIVGMGTGLGTPEWLTQKRHLWLWVRKDCSC